MSPRVLVGIVLLVICGLMLTAFMVWLPAYSSGGNIVRLALVTVLAFAGTQILWGRPLPGSHHRARGDSQS